MYQLSLHFKKDPPTVTLTTKILKNREKQNPSKINEDIYCNKTDLKLNIGPMQLTGTFSISMFCVINKF